MKPLFKNITNYDKKNYNQFIAFHQKKYSFSYTLYNIIMTILLIYCIIFGITQKNLYSTLLFSALLAVWLILRIYIPRYKYQKTENDLKQNKENAFTFSFYKFYFTINKNTIYYYKLHKVFETDDYFYLYIDEDSAALVSKSGFVTGNAEDFSDFIKKKCLLKYSKQKNKK